MYASTLKVSTGSPKTQYRGLKHISFADEDMVQNDYSTNIQIVELNALNAAMAVLKWKKLFGVYRDSSKEYYSGLSIATGEIVIEGDDDEGERD